VLELAGLTVGFVVVDAEGVFEEALGEAMTANDVAGAAFATIGQLDLAIVENVNEAKVFHAGESADGIDTAGRADVLDVGAIPFFAANPDLLEEMVKVDAVVHGDALIDGEVAVDEFDAAVGLLGDVGVVGDHENGMAGAVEFAEQADDDFFVGLVEIAGGLVGKDKLRLIDERAGDSDALLLTAGELRRQMREAMAETDALESIPGLILVGDAVEILRKHHVFESVEVRNEVELLEDEADLFGAVANEFVFTEIGEVDAVDEDMAGSERIQTTKDVDEGGLAGTRGTHKGDPFASFNVKGDAVESAEGAVLLDERIDLDLRTHSSPRKTEAGRTLAKRRNGKAAAMETKTVRATEIGYTIRRGCAATPKTAFPSHMETKMPKAEPTRPPAKPRRMASARKSRTTRRTEPPMAFIRPTSFLRSTATLLMPAITQSEVRNRTRRTVEDSRPLMRV